MKLSTIIHSQLKVAKERSLKSLGKTLNNQLALSKKVKKDKGSYQLNQKIWRITRVQTVGIMMMDKAYSRKKGDHYNTATITLAMAADVMEASTDTTESYSSIYTYLS